MHINNKKPIAASHGISWGEGTAQKFSTGARDVFNCPKMIKNMFF